MNETDKKENNEKGVNSVPYTKAGLLDESTEESGNKSNNKTGKQKEDLNAAEHTPKISKEKAAERDRERPVH